MKKLTALLCLVLALVSLSASMADADTETPLWPAYDPVTGLWGYITEDGSWGIEPQYTQAYHFHDGCAIVDMAEHAHADTPTEGIIDETGAYLLEPEYHVDDAVCWDGAGDIYLVWRHEDKGFRMGWFNIPNRYFSRLRWTECYAWSETPYILINDDYGVSGLADRATGEIVVPMEYSYTGIYDWGIDGGFIVAQRDDTRACELIEIGWGVVELPEGVVIDYYPGVSEGLIAFEQDGLHGYLNTEGEIVIPAQFDSAERFMDGYAEVGLLEEVRTSSIIDRDGNVVISGLDVYYGMVADALFVEWPDGTWGLVEPDGTIRCRHTLPEEVFDVFWLYEFTQDGPLWVEYALGDDEYLCGLMSREGELLGEPQWTQVFFRQPEEPWVTVCEGGFWDWADYVGTWGYADAYGKIVLPVVYEEAELFRGALARVQFDASTEGYINRSGEIVYQWPMPGD